MAEIISARGKLILVMWMCSIWKCAAFASQASKASGSTSTAAISFSYPISIDPSIHRGDAIRGNVVLAMGIRSFFKKRILRRDADDLNYEGRAHDAADDVDLRSILQSPASAGLMESPLGASEKAGDDQLQAAIQACSDEASRQVEGTAKVEFADMSRFDTSEKSLTKKGDASSKKSTREGRSNDKEDVLTMDMKIKLQEDAKERIRRVQGGGMTEEEKMAFLNTALTRTLPKKKPKGPPIRQKIPDGVDHDQNSSPSDSQHEQNEDITNKRKPTKKIDSTLSSRENLWNTLVGRDTQTTKREQGSNGSVTGNGGQSLIPVQSLIVGGKLKSEEAKRQWIDSITSPDRFASFSSIQRAYSPSNQTLEDPISDLDDINEVEEPEEAGDMTDEPDFVDMKRRITEDQQRFLNTNTEEQQQSPVLEALESLKNMAGMAPSSNKAKNSPSSISYDQNNYLASRLEQAAEQQEKREKDARLAAQKKLLEEKRALAQLQKQREAEFLRQETERMELARKQAEELRLKEEAKKEAEKAKMKALQAQQDAYWANKLEKERVRREGNVSTEERKLKEDQDLTRARQNEERMWRNKQEGEILKGVEGAKLHDREPTQDMLTKSASTVSRTTPKPSKEDVSVSAFVQKQRQKKEELDRLAQVRENQLKSLNSPLPAAPPRQVPSKPPSIVPQPPKTRPSELSLTSLTMKKSDNTVKPRTPASSPYSASRLQLNELTNKTGNKEMQDQTASSSSSRRLSLFEMTKLKKDTDALETSFGPRSNKKTVGASSSSSVKRPLRQQLPVTNRKTAGLEGVEEDDDLMRSPGASGLTIADALKQQRKNSGSQKEDTRGTVRQQSAVDRAKQWGVDMSKFK